jgi:hypothetical protein
MKTAIDIISDAIKESLIGLKMDGYQRGLIAEAFKKAREKEKQQIVDAYCEGDDGDYLTEKEVIYFAEKYYNQTYNQ